MSQTPFEDKKRPDLPFPWCIVDSEEAARLEHLDCDMLLSLCREAVGDPDRIVRQWLTGFDDVESGASSLLPLH